MIITGKKDQKVSYSALPFSDSLFLFFSTKEVIGQIPKSAESVNKKAIGTSIK